MKKLILAIAIFLGASPLWAELMTYQGRLKESGIPVTGNRLLAFEFCDQEDGSGVCLMAPGTPASFAVANGLFKSTITIHPNVDLAAGAWYLRVTVGSSVLDPLERLTAVPYSVFASSAGHAAYAVNAAYAAGNLLKAGDTMTGQLTLAGSTLTVTGNEFSVGGSTFVVKDGSVGIGTASPNSPLEVWTNGQYVFTGAAPTSSAVINLVPQAGGTAMINNNADGSVALAVGHTPHLLVDKTGNVGISSATPSYRLVVSSGAGEAGTIMAVSTGTSNLFWVAGDGAHAVRFVGDGSGLTGVTGATGTDPNALQLAGGTMQGPIDMNGNFLAGVSTITLNSSGSLAIVPAGTGGSNVGYGISIGSNAYNNYTNGLGIGHSARDNYLGGVGLGNTAFQNFSYGTGVGDGAFGNYSFGVGVGKGASGNYNYGVGVGANSSNNRNYASALGAYAQATTSATALGSYAKANAYASIAIGAGTVNDSTGTASFGSYGVNAAYYQINGSTVLAILPGIGSMGIGVNAGASETQSYNIYIGSGSGRNHATGTNNTMLGYLSGQSNLSGSGNTFLGSFAGLNNVSGGHNLVIGYSQDTSAGNSSYELNIGGLVFGKLNDKTVGISTRAPQAALDIVSTGTAHTQMAQIWRDSNGLIVGSMSVTGSLQAIRFVGDGSGLAGVTAAGAVQKAGDTMTGPLHILSDDLLNDTSDFITTGLVISTGGAIRTTGIGHGTVAGNARGAGAVDLQTSRAAAARVASGSYSAIGGGHNNTASAEVSAVTGGMYNVASGMAAVVSGYQNTASSGYAAVSGGFNNVASGARSVIAGGYENAAQGWGSAVSGGLYNVVSGSNSAVGGGAYNTVTGTSAVVAGGERNSATGKYSAVAGGDFNQAMGSYSAISGGWQNTASGAQSFVGGGYNNLAVGDSAVAGGANNSASGGYAVVGGGWSNTAGADHSFVGGGDGNRALAQYSFVGGGKDNRATGMYAAVPGGYNNTAEGNYSFAAGARSSSTAQGAFTWQDSGGQAINLINDVTDRTVFKNRGGFLVTGSTNASGLGSIADRGVMITGNGLVGISTYVPQAALDIVSTGTAHTQMAQLWRDSNGLIVGSMSVTGSLQAIRFVGDGSGLSGVTGATGTDNTKVLKAGDTMTGHLTIAGSSLTVVGVDTKSYSMAVGTGTLPSHLYVSTGGAVGLGTANPQAPLHLSGTATTEMLRIANPSSNATGMTFRGIGNGWLGTFASDNGGLYYNVPSNASIGFRFASVEKASVTAQGAVSAAYYQVNGSTILAMLPGVASLGVGIDAGRLNTATQNTFVGVQAGYANTTGEGNSFLGYRAGYANTTGMNNSFLGKSSAYSNTVGSYNSFLGHEAGLFNVSGGNNSYLGYAAGYNNQTGAGNSVVGSQAGRGATSQSYSSSTLMGALAGFSLTTGSDNTLYGWRAGYAITAGTGNIVIGYNQGASAPTASNELNIGGVLFGRLDQKAIGISTRAPAAALDIVSTGTAHTQMAQIWRDSNGLIVGSMSVTGSLQAIRFVGDGSGLAGVTAAGAVQKAGDTMTGALNMNGNFLAGVSTITMQGGSIAIVPPATGGSNAGYGIAIGSNAYNNYSGGVGVGRGAYGNYSYGVGVGAAAYNNYNYGVGVGSNAAGNFGSGVGVGRDTYSNNTSGVGVGAGANVNNTYGVGVGFNAGSNFNYGVGIGAFAAGNNDYAVGVGAYSDNNAGYGAALGAHSYASSSATALGAYSNANAELSLALGYGTVNNSTGTASFGDYAVRTSSAVNAAYYQINGSTVLAVLPGTNSLGVGTGAGRLATGNFNAFVGANAGYANTSGASNSFVGAGAGYANTTGSGNSFLGYGAGIANTGGHLNSFVGQFAGYSNTTGEKNSFLGSNAGNYTQTGVYNTIAGYRAGYGNIGYSYSSSTIMGAEAGYSITTGGGNTLYGWRAGYNVTTGTGNIVIGYDQGTSASGANNELNIGGVLYGDLSAGTIGISTRTPAAALDIVSTGTASNVYAQIWRDAGGVVVASISSQGHFMTSQGIPGDSLGTHNATTRLNMGNYAIWSSSHITAAAYQISGSTVLALRGSNNLAVGPNAGKVNTGQNNLFVGASAGFSDVSGSRNSYIGADAGGETTTGHGNVFLGYGAGFSVPGGYANTLLGAYTAASGDLPGAFSSSTVVGYEAGFNMSSNADANVFVGYRAGYSIFSGTGNIVIGHAQTTSASSSNNELNIGGVLYGNLSSRTIGISTRAPAAALDIVSTGTASNVYAQIWRDSSGVAKASVTATGVFYGSGAGLTGVTASDPTKLPLAGGTLTGNFRVSAATMTLTATGSSANLITAGLAGGATMVMYADLSSAGLFTNSSARIGIGPNMDEKLTVATSGVGVNRTAPGAALDVSGATRLLVDPATGYILTAGLLAQSPMFFISTAGIVGVGDFATRPASTDTVLNVSHVLMPGKEIAVGLTVLTRSDPASPISVAGEETGVLAGNFEAEAGGDDSMEHLAALRAQVRREGGAGGMVQHAAGIWVDHLYSDGGGTIVNTYGLRISTLTTAGQTNSPYAIYSEDRNARTYLAGNLGIGSAAPEAALVVSSAAGSSDKMLIVSTGTTEVFSVKGSGEIYTVGKFIGDGSLLTNLAGDGLGNHIATTTLQMGGYAIQSSTAVNAAYYQVYGNTVLAVLPNRGLNIGPLAGRISSGANNVFVGDSAGHNTTTGPRSTFLGNDSGRLNTTGTQNSYLGYGSGYGNTVGNDNTVVGAYAAYYNQTGSANAILGAGAGMSSASNSFSSATLVGYQAGYALSTGSDNILLGFRAGDNLETGSRNIIIGYDLDATASTISNEIRIGSIIYGNMATGGVGLGENNTLPAAALDVKSTATVSNVYAQIWRSSIGTIVSSMSATGVMMATKFVGDGSGLTGLSGVLKTGDTMTGALTIAGSSLTIRPAVSDAYSLYISSADGSAPALTVRPGGQLYTAGRVGIGTSTPDAALSVVQSDVAGSSYTVHIGTSASAYHLVVTTGGWVGLNTRQPQAPLHLTAATKDEGIVVEHNSNTSEGSYLALLKARGTANSQVLVANGDNLGVLAFGGYNGAPADPFPTAAAIVGRVDGTPSVSPAQDMPGRLEFMTAADGTTDMITRMVIKNDGAVGISTGNPKAMLDIRSTSTIAQIWRDAGGVARATMTASGVLYAVVGSAVQKTGDTMTGGLSINVDTTLYSTDFNTTGIRVSTAGSINTIGIGNGAVHPGARGIGAVDLQTYRLIDTEVASGGYATLSGGYRNTASSWYGTVSGGIENKANGTQYGTVSGGYQNTASGDRATVSGGASNTASDYAAAVSGGIDNTASGSRSTVSGGQFNRATAQYAAVSGGYQNTSGGYAATVSGGRSNTALGNYSWAGGYFSSSTANGSFTWSDSGGFEIRNTAADRTLFKNAGGFMVAGSTVANSSTLPPSQGMLDIISTGTTVNQYAQVWRDAGGVVKASMTANGTLYANVYGLADKVSRAGDFMYGPLSIEVADPEMDAFDLTTTGLSISTSGALQTQNFGDGTATPGPRGMGAVDLQTARTVTSQVAGGIFSVIGGGRENQAWAEGSAIGGGAGNYAGGMYSLVGGGHSNSAPGNYSAIAGGQSNSTDWGQYAFIGGGSNNTVNAERSVVSGGWYNLATGSNSVVGGGAYNTVSGTSAVVSGGEKNIASASYSAVAGGLRNTASEPYSAALAGVGNTAQAYYSVITGGYHNNIYPGSSASVIAGGEMNVIMGNSGRAFIGGGYMNYINPQASHATVAGGLQNYIYDRSEYSSIAGGNDNRIWTDALGSSIGGGSDNQVFGSSSTIAGGSGNVITSTFAFVGGGYQNRAGGQYSALAGGWSNTVNGLQAFLGAGGNNKASGPNSVVPGGSGNVASGNASAVPGGKDNTAKGNYSFAAGYRSSSTVDGTFTWSDSAGVEVLNAVADQVMFKAAGGFWVSTGTVYTDPALYVSNTNKVGIGTNTPGFKLHVKDLTGGAIAGLTSSASSTDAGVYGWSNSAATAVKGVASSGYAGRFEGKVLVTDSGTNPANPAKLQVKGDLGLGDGSQTGNTPVVIWLTASTAFSDGDVVIASGNNQFGTTTASNSFSVIGVAQGSGALSAVGKIAVAGVVVANCVGGTVGQHAVTSATAGSVSGTGLPSSGTSVGLFLTDCGNPVVGQARLLLK